jgi:cell division protein DivIC
MAGKNTPWRLLLEQIPTPLRNKYFVVLALFFAWMIFFDRHDFITQWRLQNSVNQMEEKKETYTEQIKEAKKERLDLEVNKEKFAREKYYMKKSNEDVFIIEEENSTNR